MLPYMLLIVFVLFLTIVLGTHLRLSFSSERYGSETAVQPQKSHLPLNC